MVTAVTSVGPGSGVRLAPVVADGPSVVVSDAQLLFTAEYSRVGDNLLLTGADGVELIVTGYFALDAPPILVSPSGAMMSPDLVARLVGPLAPGQVAQAGPFEGARPIGQVEDVTGTASAIRNGVPVELAPGDAVFQGDVVQTGLGSELVIGFADSTVFSLAANARMTLDEMVYDPNGSSNSLVLSIVHGTFSFVTGQIAPTGGMEVVTPVATIGIRGTTVHGVLQSIAGPLTVYLGQNQSGTDVFATLFDRVTGQPIASVSDLLSAYSISGAGAPVFIRLQTPQEQDFLDGRANTVNSTQSSFQFGYQMDQPILEQGDEREGEPDTVVTQAPPNLASGGIGIELELEDVVEGEGDLIQDLGVIGGRLFFDLGVAPGQGNQPPQASTSTQNARPNATNDAATTNEDTAVVIPVRANDSDPDGNPLTVTAVTQGANGAVAINPNGTVTYTPNPNFNGTDSFTYTLSDGVATDTATVNVTVNPVNDPPVAQPDAAAAGSGTPLTINVLDNDGDPDGNPLSIVSVTQGANGTVAIDPSGATVTYRPAPGFVGVDSFTYTVSDGTRTATATVTVAVSVNNADQIVIGTDGPDVVTTGAGNDTITTLGGADVVSSGGGNDTITPGTGDDSVNAGAGDDTILYTVGDGSDTIVGGPGTDTLVIAGAPGPNAVSITGSAGNPNLTLTVAGATLSMTGIENIVIQGGGGDDTVLIVGDLVGISPNTVTVNAVGGDDVVDASAMTSTQRLVLQGGTGNDTLIGGPGGDILTGGAGNDVIDGGAGLDVAVFAGNVAEFGLQRLQNGDLVVTDTADGSEGTDTLRNVETLRFADVDVLAADIVANHPPVDFDIAVTAQFAEVPPFSLAPGLGLGGTGDGAAPSNGAVAAASAVPAPTSNALVTGLGGPAGFGENTFTRNDDGSREVDITSVFGPQGMNFFGTFFTSIFINNNGNITFGDRQSTFTPFAITGDTGIPIIAPYFADVDTRGGPIPNFDSSGNSTGSNLVYWDLDTQDGVVTVTWDDVGYYSHHTDRSNAFQLRLFDQGGGDFGFEFRYEDVNWTTGDASDGEGGLGGDVARAGWSAGNGINFFELPQAGNQAQMLALENLASNIGFTGVWQFGVEGGVVADPVVGLGPGFVYEFQVGAEAITPADNIRGTDVEDGPTTRFTIASLPSDAAGNQVGLLLIDRGDDGVVDEIVGPGHGAVPVDVETGDSVYYFLARGSVETLPESVGFTYFTTDSGGLPSDGATVTIEFANAPPVAVDDVGATDEDTPLPVAAPGVLFNDTDPDPGDTLVVSAVQGSAANVGQQIALASGALLTMNADGGYQYDPNGAFDFLGAGDSTTDSFTYTVSDGNGGEDTATATITIAGVNDPPSDLALSGASVAEDAGVGAVVGTVLVDDPDLGDTHTFALLDGGESLFAIDPATGVVTVDGALDFESAASHQIQVRATDAGGLSVVRTLTVTVTNVNDAPVVDLNGDGAGIDSSTVFTEGDAPVPIAPGATIADVDSDTLASISILLTGALDGNSELLSGPGFTPGASLAEFQQVLRSMTYQNTSENPTPGVRTIQVVADDGSGTDNLSVLAVASVEVFAVNDAPVNTVPGDQQVAPGVGLTFTGPNAISTADPDAGASDLRVTLGVLNGTLTLSGIAGLAFSVGDGTADATMTFTGTLANVNAALTGLTYTPTAGFVGQDILTITTDDQGNTGAGGALSDTDTIAITVSDQSGDVIFGDPLIVGDAGAGTFTLGPGTSLALSSVVVGRQTTGDGTLVVTGDGTALNVTEGTSLIVGAAGTGTEDITAGATTTVGVAGSDAFMIIGDQPTGDGTVTVDDATLIVNGSGGLTVGNAGQGTLRIENGALVESTSGEFNNVEIGLGSGGNGAVIVTGEGSTLRTLGADNTVKLAEGVGSTASLTVETGGTVRTAQLEVGRHGMGTATIDGGTIVVSMDDGRFTDPGFELEAGFVRIGRFSDGEGVLRVINGGLLQVRPDLAGETSAPGVSIGRNLGSSGTLIVDGLGSRVEIVQTTQELPALGDPTQAEGAFLSVGAGSSQGRLEVTNQGTASLIGFSDFSFTVGQNEVGSGSVLVDGVGSSLTLRADNATPVVAGLTFADPSVTIGRSGFGEMTVSNGGAFSASAVGGLNFAIGNQSSGVGTVTVDNATFTVNGSGGLAVGNQGRGELVLRNGALAEITSDGFNNVDIGRSVGGIGTVTVTGPGTTLRTLGTDNTIQVGRAGTGTFTAEAGATVETLEFDVGFEGTGTATITGKNTTLVVSNDHGRFSGDFDFEAGFLGVGFLPGGHGTLNVLDGATVEIRSGTGVNEDTVEPGLQIGRSFGSEGTVLVDGADSLIEILQTNPDSGDPFGPFVQVGLKGRGAMTVSNQAEVRLIGPDANFLVSSDSALNLIGPPEGVPLERSTLEILSGGKVLLDGQDDFARFDVSRQDGGDGFVRISGLGSGLETRGTENTVQVGRIGHGEMLVEDGGTVRTLQFEVGRSGTGIATFTGEGTTLVASNDGGLFIGGEDIFAGFVRVGRNDGSDGTLNVLDRARVEIRSGTGVNEDTVEPGLQIARELGSTGRVLVDGLGSIIDITQTAPADPGNGIFGPFIQVGSSGDGTLTIGNEGEVNLTGENSFVTIARNSGSYGTLEIANGGQLTLTGADSGMHIARAGTGSMTVRDGGTVTVTGDDVAVTVGRDAGAEGTLAILSGGQMTLNGGAVSTQLKIGQDLGSQGTVLVEGTDSKISVTGTDTGSSFAHVLRVGHRGTGTLETRDGGSVESLRVDIGTFQTGVGTALVDDATWTIGSNALNVGREGEGTLTIRNGGSVTVDGAARIAWTGGSTGTINVRSGSELLVDGQLRVGDGAFDPLDPGGPFGQDATAFGTLNVYGGTVTSQGANIGGQARGDGTVVVGHGGTWTNAGNLNVGNEGDGTLTIARGGAVSVTGGEVTVAIANAGGSHGTAIVRGPGSELEVDGFMVVGNAFVDSDGGFGEDDVLTEGALRLFGGAAVTVTGDLTVGADDSDADGTVLVSGASALDVGATIDVGTGEGTGTLTIVNGGSVSAATVNVGANGVLVAGKGAVTVGGFTLTNDAGGTVILGDGPGTLSVNGSYSQDSGELLLKLGLGGANVALSGTASFGEGATVRLQQQTDVRFGDAFALSALGALGIAAEDVAIEFASGFGVYVQEGDDAVGFTTIIDGGEVVDNGFPYTAPVEIVDDVQLILDDIDGAEGATSLSVVSSAGQDSLVAVNGTVDTGQISVTGQGTSQLTLNRESTANQATVDQAGDGTSTLVVGSPGSLDVSNLVVVGNAGAGLAELFVHGALTVPELRIARQAGSLGHVFVDGGDLSVTGSSTLIVGNQGTGFLTVERGGTVSALGLIVGSQGGATGTVLVDGDGSRLTVGAADAIDPFLFVGRNGGTGSLTVSNGATLEAVDLQAGRSGGDDDLPENLTDDPEIAPGSRSDGTITVTGVGTLVRVSNDFGTFSAPFDNEGGFLRVGRHDGDVGEMTVENGARVEISAAPDKSGPILQIARNPGSEGTVVVDNATIEIFQAGPATELDGGPRLIVGRAGQGEMTIRNEAVVRITGDDARVRVSRGNTDEGGTDSLLAQSRLDIQGGGKLIVDSGANPIAANIVIGARENGNGVLTVSGVSAVDGAPSEIVLTGGIAGEQAAFLSVGLRGEGELQLLGGARLFIDGETGEYAGFQSGRSAGSDGTIIVDGVGSNITIVSALSDFKSGYIAIGRSGNGHLEITNGATVTNEATGLMLIGGDLVTTPGTGTVLVEGADAATISALNAGAFLLVGEEFDFTNGIPLGPGTGGTGTLTIGDFGVVNAGQVRVGTDGTLGGDGVLAAATTTLDGGAIAPGASAGTLTIDGDFVLSSGRVEAELGGILPGDSDLIDISGAASILGGRIDFTLLEYLPQAGDAIDILSAAGGLAANADDVSLAISGVTVGFDFDVSFGANDITFTALSDAVAGSSAIFRGGNLDDAYAGGGGDDVLRGGGGNDSLTGGAGADIFGFSLLSNEGSDAILDFSGTGGDGDVLSFTDVVDTNADGIDIDDAVASFAKAGSTVTVGLHSGTIIAIEDINSVLNSLSDLDDHSLINGV